MISHLIWTLRKINIFIIDSTGDNKIETTFHSKKVRHLIYQIFFCFCRVGAKKVVLTANEAAVGTINDITKSEKSRGFPDKSAPLE